MPLIKHHCDQIELRHGVMYCPTKSELNKITEDIYDRLDEDMDDDNDDNGYRGYYSEN